jgi:hypothetical protein
VLIQDYLLHTIDSSSLFISMKHAESIITNSILTGNSSKLVATLHTQNMVMPPSFKFKVQNKKAGNCKSLQFLVRLA